MKALNWKKNIGLALSVIFLLFGSMGLTGCETGGEVETEEEIEPETGIEGEEEMEMEEGEEMEMEEE